MLSPEYINFLDSIKKQIRISQYKAIRAVNIELITLYYNIGKEILKRQKEFGWGAKVIEQLSQDLSQAFPEMKGFSARNLHNMRRFSELYQDDEILQQAAGALPNSTIVQQVAAQLPWYHHIVLMEKVKDQNAREFYIKKAVENGWSRAVMVHQIELNLYERQGKATNNFADQLPAPQSDLAHQTFKDPYIFDFLNLSQEVSERELEKALIERVEKFLLELGEGFAFLGRQYHLEIEKEDYDLRRSYNV